MQLNAGDHVGPYEVLGPLGTGGMGTVYRARDPKLGRQIAIKILQERLIDSPEYLTRFEQEARSASALNHPNIITIHEIGDFGGAPYIAMELVEGKRLRDLLREGPPGLRKSLQIATQIADGLAAAHERGIVHRDLKPENVMITGEGLVKILDFGLARLRKEPAETDDSTSALITAEGAVIGTAGYMSPEQANGSRVDFRSDQFSLGSILYEMLTLKNPFRRATTLDTLSAIVHEDPEAIDQLNPRTPPPLRWIIDRCLAKDPAERYASTRDLARDLQTVREHLAETTTQETPLIPRRLFSLTARRVAFSAAGAILLAAVGFTIWQTREPKTAEAITKGVSLPEIKYVAVLPFKDLSGRPEGRLISEGLADAVSVRLVRISGLQIIPPSAAAQLVAANADWGRISDELGANVLLHATVQSAGEKLRVTFSLVDPKRGVQFGGDTVTGSTADLFEIQDQLAEAASAALEVRSRTMPAARPAGLNSPEEQDRYLRALAYLQQFENPSSVGRAVVVLEDLVRSSPQSSLVQAALGRAYLYNYRLTHDRKWSDRAIAAGDRARALDPDAADVHLTLGEVHRTTGKYEQAIAEYQRALSAQPNSPEAALGLAQAYEANRQFDRAEKTYRRGIDLRPAWWATHNRLGKFYFNRGQYDDASRMFREAMRLNPENPWPYSNLGAMQVLQGDFAGGVQTLSKAVSLAPDAAAYSNLGHAYYFLGEYSKASDAFREATGLKPSVATYWANLGDACSWAMPEQRQQCLAHYRKAIQLLTETLAVNPNDAGAHGTLAVCLAKTGNASKASIHIREARRLEPQNPARMYQAARVANLTGDPVGAIEWLRRAFADGYSTTEVERDPEFRSLQQNEAFQEVVTKAKSTAT